jgi:gas vesicle protein
MADNNGDLGSFLAGFMIGGLIGAGVALLMAPQSGEETRAYIKDKGIELRDQAAETAGEVQTRASDLAQQTAKAYEEQIQRLQAAVDASKKKPAKKTAEKAADESEAEAPAEA